MPAPRQPSNMISINFLFEIYKLALSRQERMSNQACQSIQLHRFVRIFVLVSISLLPGKFHLLLILLICSSLIFSPQAHKASNERCPLTSNWPCPPALHSSCFSWPREQRKPFHIWLKSILVRYPNTGVISVKSAGIPWQHIVHIWDQPLHPVPLVAVLFGATWFFKTQQKVLIFSGGEGNLSLQNLYENILSLFNREIKLKNYQKISSAFQ